MRRVMPLFCMNTFSHKLNYLFLVHDMYTVCIYTDSNQASLELLDSNLYIYTKTLLW